MSKKRGLSFDEKRSKMLEIFHDSKSFFQLRDLEKIAPKEKGIVLQTVKEVLQSLVDDGVVDTEKIGTSNYFWSFPSKVYNKRKTQVAELEESIENAKKKHKALQKEIEELRVGKEDTDDRSSIQEQIQKVEAKQKELAAELAQFNECNPEVLDKKREVARVAVDSANRWTDNVFAIRSWTSKKFMQDESALNKAFSIPEDFDYIETK